MKLYDAPITSIDYNGKTYKLNLYYNRVLEALDFLEDERFDPMDRVNYCLWLLVDGKHPVDEGLLVAIFEAIFPQKKSKKKERLLDYEQDRGLIYAAFWQSYGIDLNREREKMHWQTFLDLMQGLPSNTRLAEVINIRARPMPKPTKYNAEERAELARLKQEYKIELSEREKQENLQTGLAKIASCLLQLAERGEGKRQTEL